MLIVLRRKKGFGCYLLHLSEKTGGSYYRTQNLYMDSVVQKWQVLLICSHLFLSLYENMNTLCEGEIPVKTKQSIVYELEPKITHFDWTKNNILLELKKNTFFSVFKFQWNAFLVQLKLLFQVGENHKIASERIFHQNFSHSNIKVNGWDRFLMFTHFLVPIWSFPHCLIIHVSCVYI